MRHVIVTVLCIVIGFSGICQSWSTTGNSGVTPPVNYLGTNDANALAFKVKAQNAGYIDYLASKANTTFGFQTLNNLSGDNNAAFGYRASYSNTSGRNNSSFGSYALYSNKSGFSNVAIGVGAIFKNMLGRNLVAVGDSALYNQTAAFGNNTAIGSKVLYATTTGTDNTGVGFRTMFSNTTGKENTAVGVSALNVNTTGSQNTATGFQALFSNITGSQNTANGYQALFNNTGILNTAMGFKAMYTNNSGNFNAGVGCFSLLNNTSGYSNAAFGYSALYGNTTGYFNTAAGTLSLTTNSSGFSNTAFGYRSMYFNNLGNYNTAVGNTAMYNNVSGSYNTSIGEEALYSNTTGQYNTAVGGATLFNNVSSNYNTAIGFFALTYAQNIGYNNVAVGAFAGPDVNSDNIYNSIAIGEESLVTASNQARIGNASTTSIGGYTNWSNVSDGRIKQNIKQNVPGLQFINKLRAVTYNLNLTALNSIIPAVVKKDIEGNILSAPPEESLNRKAKEKIVYTGFVAQDVERAAKDLGFTFSGVDAPKNEHDLYGLRYAEFVVPLVQAVQELSQQNEKMKSDYDAKIETLQKQLNDLKTLLLQGNLQGNKTSVLQSSARLEQNVPNPFTSETRINYTLPQTYNHAYIVVSDKSGNTLKNIPLSGKGKGGINLNGNGWTGGAYQYALYIDDVLIASKQMIFSK